MKKVKYTILLLSLAATLASCAIAQSLLGYNECAYDGCKREAEDNSIYCAFHTTSYPLPENFSKNVGKSIDNQMKRYNRQQQGQGGL